MKKGMKGGTKKYYFAAAFVFVLILLSGVFAESIGLTGNAKEAVDSIVENQGIDKEDIKSVERVDFESLPPQVDLKNIDETNLEVYEVDYGGDKPLFVITASNVAVEPPKTDVVYKRMLLDFGLNKEVSDSLFLNTPTGVEGDLETGYVMMRDGSITGLSTNMEVLSGEGSVEVVVYVNGNPAGFRNTISADSIGVKKDYDTQSYGIVKFNKGDVISVYLKIDGSVFVKDVINLVEISTD